MIVGAAEEPEPVRQDLERSLAEHQAVHLRPLFEDLEDEVLFLKPRVIADLLFAGQQQQVFHREPLQLGDVDVAALDFLVTIVSRKRIGGKFVAGFLESGAVLLEVFLRIVLGRRGRVSLAMAGSF